MDFIKKNYGLLLFFIICLGVIIYQLIALIGVQGEREKNRAERQTHLERLQKVRSAHRRLDEPNQLKAEKVAESAKAQYYNFVNNLSKKRLLPGIDFTVDPDEPATDAGTAEPQYDEDGKLIPPVPKVDPYKDLPYRKKFDAWMKGSLADAREILINELLMINKKYFKEDEPDSSTDNSSDLTDKRKQELIREALKKAREAKEAAKEEGKSTYDFEKEKRSKIVKGVNVPEYFMFEEYVRERENGLRSKKEKRDVFRQVLLLNTIVSYLQQAEITELNSIEFPCGLEIIDGDAYTSTPIAISMTGKPECVESFMNLLNANEHYLFFLKDIVSFDAEIQLNEDPELYFNNNGEASGAALLQSYLESARTESTKDGVSTNIGRESRRASSPVIRRREPQTTITRTTARGIDGEIAEEPVAKTRKAFRIFAKMVEEGEDSSQRVGNDLLRKRGSASTEVGTSVTVTINFEYVEFKPVNN